MCRYENGSLHGGLITDVDAMVYMTQLNYSVPGSWNAELALQKQYGPLMTP